MRISENDFQLIARGIGENGLVKFGSFTLASGKTSPIYIDLRLLRSFPDLIYKVASAMSDIVLASVSFDRIADVPTAGTPIATLISQITGIPMLTPRGDVKAHGSGAKIDGVFEKGEMVLVVDDLITTAGSKLKAIEILEETGLVVRDVLILVDRQQGGAEELAKRGYILHVAFTISELLEFMENENMIGREQYARVMAYLFPSSK